MLQEGLWIKRLATEAGIEVATSESLWSALIQQVEYRLLEGQTLSFDALGLWSLAMQSEFVAETEGKAYLIPPAMSLHIAAENHSVQGGGGAVRIVPLAQLSEALHLSVPIPLSYIHTWLRSIPTLCLQLLDAGHQVVWQNLGVWQSVEGHLSFCVAKVFAQHLNRAFEHFKPEALGHSSALADLPRRSVDLASLNEAQTHYLPKAQKQAEQATIGLDDADDILPLNPQIEVVNDQSVEPKPNTTKEEGEGESPLLLTAQPRSEEETPQSENTFIHIEHQEEGKGSECEIIQAESAPELTEEELEHLAVVGDERNNTDEEDVRSAKEEVPNPVPNDRRKWSYLFILILLGLLLSFALSYFMTLQAGRELSPQDSFTEEGAKAPTKEALEQVLPQDSLGYQAKEAQDSTQANIEQVQPEPTNTIAEPSEPQNQVNVEEKAQAQSPQNKINKSEGQKQSEASQGGVQSVKAMTPPPTHKEGAKASQGQNPQPIKAQSETLPQRRHQAEDIVLASGESLAGIAERKYGHRAFWVYIYEENRERIPNPHNVAVGTALHLPSASKYGIDPNNTKSLNQALLLSKSL